MAESTVLRDVGVSLKELLKGHISELRGEKAICFDSPGEMESGESTRLCIFLFQVSPNPHLRNIEGEPLGEKKIIFPPLPVELTYIFTVYAEHRETELTFTDRVAQVLFDYPVLKGDMLKNNLRDQQNEEINIIPLTLSLDDMNKLWGTFRDKPFKLSLCYQMSPVMIPSNKDPKTISRVAKQTVKTYWKPPKEGQAS